jgi:hypothetical protein
MNEINLKDLEILYDNPIDSSTGGSGLNARLNEMNDALAELEEVEKNGISRQSDIKDIIEDESDRLDQKKKTIDQAIMAQNRIIYFNDNTRKIYAAYLKMLIVAAITLAIVYVLLVAKVHLDFIPDFVIEILIIAVVSIGVIIIYNMYVNIRYRNLYNFDEIDYAAPTQRPDEYKISGSSITFEEENVCVGRECCKPATDTSPGAIWDDSVGKCISNTEAFEYENYSPYE